MGNEISCRRVMTLLLNPTMWSQVMFWLSEKSALWSLWRFSVLFHLLVCPANNPSPPKVMGLWKLSLIWKHLIYTETRKFPKSDLRDSREWQVLWWRLNGLHLPWISTSIQEINRYVVSMTVGQSPRVPQATLGLDGTDGEGASNKGRKRVKLVGLCILLEPCACSLYMF